MNLKTVVSISLVIFFLVIGSLFIVNQFNNQTTTSSTTISTNPTAVVASASQTYKLSDIATHNSATSCWVAVNQNVYDLTPFINQHSGGADTITRSCGQDASSYFNSKHGSRELQVMSQYLLGKLN